MVSFKLIVNFSQLPGTIFKIICSWFRVHWWGARVYTILFLCTLATPGFWPRSGSSSLFVTSRPFITTTRPSASWPASTSPPRARSWPWAWPPWPLLRAWPWPRPSPGFLGVSWPWPGARSWSSPSASAPRPTSFPTTPASTSGLISATTSAFTSWCSFLLFLLSLFLSFFSLCFSLFSSLFYSLCNFTLQIFQLFSDFDKSQM